jgi:hypothetical protein
MARTSGFLRSFWSLFGRTSPQPGSGRSSRWRWGRTLPILLERLEDRTLLSNYGMLPLSFEANQGQADPSVQFLTRGNGFGLFLRQTDAVLLLTQPAASSSGQGPTLSTAVADAKVSVLDVQLVGASGSTPGMGLDGQSGVSNYLTGNDPQQWQLNVPEFGRVAYQNVYPGITLIYHGTDQEQLQYDIEVAPGADPSQVQFNFQGADSLAIDAGGNLVVTVGTQQVVEHAPVIFQTVNGVQQPVTGGYVLRGGSRVAFSIGTYDATLLLTIDPTLAYSTYLGGSGADFGEAIAADAAGNAYVTGYTPSTNFPIAGALQGTYQGGANDAFVTKLNAAGTALVYSTYLGGNGNDRGHGIAVDAAGEAYVTGLTSSTNFPTLNAFQPTFGGGTDAFVTKLNPAGNGLVYSTYLGGSGGEDNGFVFDTYPTEVDWFSGAIAVDNSGRAWVTGVTFSGNFPTTANAFSRTYSGSWDDFVARFSADGSGLDYSSYLGGSSNATQAGRSIAVDPAGNAYVGGWTFATDFPTTAGAFQRTLTGSVDVTVSKFDASKSGAQSLVYSTLIGGSADSWGTSVAVDGGGNAYVTGFTASVDYPTTAGASQTVKGTGEDAFVTKVNPTGTGLVYSTFLGGNGDDSGSGIAVDSAGGATVAGVTPATNFPIANAVQATYGGGDIDGFATRLNATGSALVYSTYLGGSSGDQGMGVALDRAGNSYVVGTTRSTNFPAPSGFRSTSAGGSDAFVSQIRNPTLTVTNTNDSGAGSLRQAILSANAGIGVLQTITFNIPGTGPFTIQPLTPLPAITAPTVLDATTEPGYAGSPMIELNGTSAGAGVAGLTITAGGSVVKGFIIDRFSGDGIDLTTNGGDTIQANYIGTNVTGAAAAPNGGSGIVITTANNVIGGTMDAAVRNVISGNTGNGIDLSGAAATGNVVIGYVVGTNASGTVAVANGADGIKIENGASGNTIGSSAPSPAPATPVATNLALWLNADQGVTTGGSSQVTSWTDQTGHGFNGATVGSGVTLVPNALNGHSAVQFTGAGALALTGQVLTSQQYTVIAVVTDQRTDTSFREVFSNWTSANGITSVFLGTANNNPDRARFSDYMGGATDPNGHVQTGVGTVANPTQAFMLTGESTATDAFIYQNQSLIAQQGAAIPTRNLTTQYFVGEQGTINGEFWKGNISELLVYNSALSQADLQATWAYLQGKYFAQPVNVISGNAQNGVEISGSGASVPVAPTVTTMPESSTTFAAGTNFSGFVSQTNNPLGPFSGQPATFVGWQQTGGSAETLNGAHLVYRYKLQFNQQTSLASVTVSGAAFNGPNNVLRVLDANSNVLATLSTSGGNSYQTFVLTVNQTGTVFYLDEFDTSTTWRYRDRITVNARAVLPSTATAGNIVQGNFIGTNAAGTAALGNSRYGVYLNTASINSIVNNVVSGNGSDGVNITGNGSRAGTVSWWKAEGNANDSVDSNQGVTEGGLAFGSGRGGDQAFNLNGTNADVRVPASTNLDASAPFSFDTWIKADPAQFSPDQLFAVLDKSHGFGDLTGWVLQGEYSAAGYTLDLNRPLVIGELVFGLGTGTGFISVGTRVSVLDNQWHHIAGVFTGSATSIYMDGVQTETRAVSGSFVNNLRDFFMGRAWGGGSPTRYFHGLIDDVAVYNRGLSAAEVQGIYQSGGPSKGGATIQGNLIGTNAAGTAAVVNGGSGVTISNSAGNTVGGTTAAARNVISGNGLHGVLIDQSQQNVVVGNYVGTNSTGSVAIGNAGNGVQLSNSANNTIGGVTAGAGNVISGNHSNGIWIPGVNPNNNVIQGNFIGLNAAGTAAIGNSATGVLIDAGTGNQVGGNVAGAGNVISGNGANGVAIRFVGTSQNMVAGNFIGTNAAGSAAVPNSANGIVISGGASGNTIGGLTATPGTGAGNVVSGNNQRGVAVFNGTNNVIQGNIIGLNAAGNAALANAFQGVEVGSGSGNTIGGTAAGARNVISGNTGGFGGILIDGTSANVVQGNYVGTDITGMVAIANSVGGIQIIGASNNTVGGTTAAAANIISGNGQNGVYIVNANNFFGLTAPANNNVVSGNNIGVAADGVTTLANGVGGGSDVLVAPGSGAVTFSGSILTGPSGVSVTAPSIQWSATLATASAAVTLAGPLTLVGDAGISTTLSGTGAGITFGGTVDGAFALTTSSGVGTTTFSGSIGQTTALSSLTTNGAATVMNGAAVTTTANQTYNDAVTFTAALATLQGGNLSFAAPVSANSLSITSTGGTTFANTLTTGPLAVSASGAASFTKAVSAGVTTVSSGQSITFYQTLSASDVTATSGVSVAFNGAVLATTLTLPGNGVTTIGTGTVNTTGNQTYHGAVNLAVPSALAASAGDVSFVSTVGGAGLTVNAGGAVGFGAAVSNSSVAATSAGATSFSDTVTTGPLTVTAGAAASFAKAVSAGPTNVSSVQSTSFSQTLTAAGVTVSSGAGVTFGGLVTASGLTVASSSGTTVNTSAVNTTGTQTYTGAVNLLVSCTFTATAGNVTFHGAVSGAGLTVTASGVVTFDAPVTNSSVSVTSGGATSFADILSTGALSVASGGAASFNKAVSAAATTVSSGLDTTFGASLTVTDATVLSAAGVFLDGAIGATTLTVTSSGPTTVNTTAVSSTGKQNFNGAVTLAVAATFAATGGDVTFGSTVGGAGLTVNAGGAISFGAAVSTTSLTVTSTAATAFADAVTTGPLAVTAGGAVSFAKAVNAGATNVSSGQGTTFSQTLTTANLSLTSGAGITLAGVVTATTLTIASTGVTTINTASVSTTGNQTYNGAVNLAAPSTLSASAGDLALNNTVSGLALTVTVGGAAGFAAPVTSSSVNVTSGGATSFSDTLTTGALTVTAGGAASFSKAVSAGTTIVSSGQGTTFSAALTAGAVTVTSGAGVSVGGIVTAASLTVGSTGTTTIATASVNTAGAQTYNGAVNIAVPSTLTTTTGDVAFNNTVTGAALTVNAGGAAHFAAPVTTAALNVSSSGATTFADTIATGTLGVAAGSVASFNKSVNAASTVVSSGQGTTFSQSLTAAGLTLTSGAGVTLNGVVSAVTLTITSSGTTTVNTTSVSTTGNQTYNGAVNLAMPSTLTASAGDVALNSTVGGAGLTVNAGGAATFAAAVSSASILVGSGASATFSGTLNTGNLGVTAGATANFQKAVSAGATSVSSGQSTTFFQTLTAAAATVTSGAGVTLNGVVTAASLAVTSIATTTINAATVTTTGGQTYTGVVTLGLPTLLAGTTVTFNDAILGGNFGLTVNGNAVFGDDPADSVTGVTVLSVSGASVINTSTVTTSGTQTYSGPVTLGTNTTLTSGAGGVSFGSTVNGAFALTLNSGVTTFSGAVGGSSPVQRITTDAFGTTFINAAMTATGDLTFNDAVRLTADVTLTDSGTGVVFTSTLDSDSTPRSVTVAGSGGATFGGAVGGVSPLASLTQAVGSGLATLRKNVSLGSGGGNFHENVLLNGLATLTSGGVLVFGDNASLDQLTVAGALPVFWDTSAANASVTVNAATTLSQDLTVKSGAGNVTFNGSINGHQTLTVNSGGVTLFNGNVGDITPLKAVITDAGGSTTPGPAMQTAGDLTFNDPIFLTRDTFLTDSGSQSTGITFKSTVDNADGLTPHGLTVKSNRPKTFSKAVGHQFPLAFLTTDVVDPNQFAVPTQLNGGEIDTTGDQSYNDAVNLGVKTSFNAGGSTNFGGALTQPPGVTDATLELTAGANTKKIDLSKAKGIDATVKLTTAAPTVQPVILGGQGTTHIVKGENDHVSFTYVGGGPGSHSDLDIVVASDVTLVDGGGINTLNFTHATLGVTIDLNKAAGEKQFVYRTDPSLLPPFTETNGAPPTAPANRLNDSLTLFGKFQNVITATGGGDTIIAAEPPVGSTAFVGSTIITQGGKNTIVTHLGAKVITSLTGGDTIIQALSSGELQEVSALDPTALQTVSNLDPTALQGLANLDPSALLAVANLDPATLTAIANLNAAALQAVANLTPTALTAVANLTPSALQAVANLGLDALAAVANLGPSTLAAIANLDPTALTAIANLNPSALQAVANLDPTSLQAIANLGPTTLSAIANLGPSALQAVANLDPTTLSAIANLGPTTLSAVANLGPSALPAVANLSPAALQAIANLGPSALSAVANLGPSALQGLANLGPSALGAIANLSPAALTAVANLSPSALSGIANLGPTALSAIANLEPSALSAVANLGPTTLSAVANLGPSALQAIANLGPSALQAIANLTPSALQAIANLGPSALQAVANLGPSALTAVANLGPSTLSAIANLGPSALQAIANLGPSALSAIANLTPATLSAIANLGPSALSAVANLSPTVLAAVANLDPAALTAVANLDPTALSAIANLGPTALSAIANLGPSGLSAIANLGPSALQALANLGPTALQAVANLSPSALTAIANLGPSTLSAIANLDPTALAAVANLGPTTLSAIANLGPSALSAVANLGPTALAAIADLGATALQAIANLDPTALAAIANLGPTALAAVANLDPTVLAALANLGPSTLAAVANLDPATLAAIANLGPTALAAVANLDPTALSAIANLGPSALSALANLSPATLSAIASLGPTALNAIVGLDPTTLTALASLDPAALSAIANLGPSALSAVANLDPATLSAVANLGPSALAAVANLNPTTLSAIAKLGPTALQAVANLGPSALQAIANLGPTALQAVANLSPSALTAIANLGPTTLQAVANLNPAALSAVAGLSPSALSAIANLGPTGLSAVANLGPSALQAVANLGPTALSAIANLGPTALAAIANLGPTVLSAIANLGPTALQAIANLGPTALTAVANLGPTALSAVANLSPSVLSAVANLGPSALAAIANLSPSALAAVASLDPTALQAIANLGPTALQAIANLGPTALSAIANLGPSALQAIANLGPTALQAVANLGPTALSAIANLGPSALSAIANLDPAILQALAKLGPSALSAIANLGPSALSVIANLGPTALQAIANLGPTALQAIANLGPAALQAIANLGPTGLQAIANLGPTALQAIANLGPAALQAIANLGPSSLQAIANLGPSALQALANLGPAALQAIANLGPAALQAVANLGPTVLQAVANLGPAALQAIANLGPTALQAIANLGPTALSAIANLGPTALSTIANLGPTALQAIANLGPAALTAIANLSAAALTAIANLGPSTLQAITNLGPTVLQAIANLGPAALQSLANLDPASLSAIAHLAPATLVAIGNLAKQNPTLFSILSSVVTVNGGNSNARVGLLSHVNVQSDNNLIVQTLSQGEQDVVRSLNAKLGSNPAALTLLASKLNFTGNFNTVTAGLLANIVYTGNQNNYFEERLTADEVQLVSDLTALAMTPQQIDDAVGVHVTMADGNNVIAGGALGHFTTGNGNNLIFIEDPTLMGVSTSTPASAIAALTQNGGVFSAGSGNNKFYFVGQRLGNVTVDQKYFAAGIDTLDFSAFTGDGVHGVNVDLQVANMSQPANPNLTLMLTDANGISNVIGTRFDDTILGNGRDNKLFGGASAGADSINPVVMPPVSPATPTWDGRTQIVYLDFTSSTSTTGNGQFVYTTAVRNAILAGLQQIYQGFEFQFTLVQPQSGPYATVFFNKTPPTGLPGGFSNDIDFRNLNLGGAAAEVDVDIYGFLNGSGQPVDDVPNHQNAIAMSIAIAAHEMGHGAAGFRHADAFGPIGTGIHNPPGIIAYDPPYPGLAAAFESTNHVIDTPASEGSSILDLVDAHYLGDRELVKLAFDQQATGQNGLVRDEQTLPSDGQFGSDPVHGIGSLPGLYVPNTEAAQAFHYGYQFDVGAVDVRGAIGAVGQNDVYSFNGQAGQVINLTVMSSALATGIQPRFTDPIDPRVWVYDANHTLVAYYTTPAFNNDEFETPDATIIDLTLPASGKYFVVVNNNETANPNGVGHYELFMYRFGVYLPNGGFDGNDTLSGRGGSNTLQGGTGLNTVVDQGDVNFTLSNSQLQFGSATDSLANIQNAVLTGGPSANAFAINSWASTVTMNGGGTDSLAAPTIQAGESILFNGNLDPLSVAQDIAGSITVTGSVGTATIGGAVTGTGVVHVGNIASMVIGPSSVKSAGHDLAGQLTVDNTLTSLRVAGGTPGTIVAGHIGTVGVYGAYGPLVAQIKENGIQRRVEAAVPGQDYVVAVTPPAALPVSPANVNFQFFYESGALTNPQLTARVANPSASKDQFDLSLVTFNDAAKFNLARLDAAVVSGTNPTAISGIRNVAVEGDLLSNVSSAAQNFFALPNSTGGVRLPADRLAGVAVRDFASNFSIQASSIQALAFGSISRWWDGCGEMGFNSDDDDVARLLASGTQVVQANDTFRVPFADLPTQQVAMFLATEDRGGELDDEGILFTVQGVTSPNAAGTGNIFSPSNVARGAATALVNVSYTVDSRGRPRDSVVNSVAIRGDGASIRSEQSIRSITSTGPLGDVSIESDGGGATNVSAPSIFGSIDFDDTALTGVIQTTGLRTDPITGATSTVPADLGRVYVGFDWRGGPYLTSTTLHSEGGALTGQIISRGNLVSQIIADGGIAGTGIIAVQGDLGVMVGSTRLGGIVSNGPLSGETIVLGNVVANSTINGGLKTGRVGVYGNITGNLTINGTIDGRSALVVHGNVGTSAAPALSQNGNILGIVAVEGNLFASKLGSTNKALFYGKNLTAGVNKGWIDAVFTQDGSNAFLVPPGTPTITTFGTGTDLTTVNLLVTHLSHLTASGGNLASSGANAKSLALVTDGSTADNSSAALVGSLIEADLWVFVDNSTAEFTADELARIQDTLTQLNVLLSAYGMSVTQVGDDSAAWANIRLDMNDTSSIGGAADGVLGVTINSGALTHITLINGWNWYSGSDTASVGSLQYDFQTVATHELGHAIGLGHSADATSVMYALLDPGQTKRVLKDVDLNVGGSGDGGGPEPLMAAPMYKGHLPGCACPACVASLRGATHGAGCNCPACAAAAKAASAATAPLAQSAQTTAFPGGVLNSALALDLVGGAAAFQAGEPNQVLLAGAGNDLQIGDAGRDYLIGGVGRERANATHAANDAALTPQQALLSRVLADDGYASAAADTSSALDRFFAQHAQAHDPWEDGIAGLLNRRHDKAL